MIYTKFIFPQLKNIDLFASPEQVLDSNSLSDKRGLGFVEEPWSKPRGYLSL
jgi:hypothetical protein